MGISHRAIRHKFVQWIILKAVARYTKFDPRKVGAVIDLQFEPGKGLLKAKLDLRGEEKPLVIEEAKFDVKGKQVQINSVHTDREWMNILADEFLPTSFEAPSVVLSALRMLK